MDDSKNPRNKHNEHLGVNKISKNIRKTPLLPQSILQSAPATARPVSQPQVYNINKSDFRNIVQQLTGSPLHHPQPPPRPPVNHHTTRLHRIRPPPLSPINITTPQIPLPLPVPINNNNNNNNQFSQPVESPISAYMRYLQHSINEPGPGNPQAQSAGLLPNPHIQLPRTGPLLPTPSGYYLPSPRSPYPLLSPGYQYPPELPNFTFSPGILGPGPQSPDISFPLSPGFFPGLSPRWRE